MDIVEELNIIADSRDWAYGPSEDLRIEVKAAKEIEKLRSIVEDQQATIKALVFGCEKYGLTETTPIVRFMDAQEAQIEYLQKELSFATSALRKWRARWILSNNEHNL